MRTLPEHRPEPAATRRHRHARLRGGTKSAAITVASASIAALSIWLGMGRGDTSASVTVRTLVPSADAYVNASQPATNFGTGTKIRVDGSPIMRSYLRFDVPALDGPITRATLNVYANSRSSAGYDVSVVPAALWSESTITFQNAPVNPPVNAPAIVASSAAFPAGTWTAVDVSSLITGSGSYTLVLSGRNTTQISLASRESSNAPQLVLETTAPPSSTPTSAPPFATSTSTPTSRTSPASTSTSTPTSRTSPAASTSTSTATATPVAPSPTPTRAGSPSLTFPIRAAFYYPWFSPAWTQQGIFPYTNYHPSLGYYDERDQATIKQHIAAMQYGNIGAGIASWWGQGTYTDARIADLLTASAGTTFQWSLYYEPEGQGDPSVAQITSDLTYIRDHYAASPNFLHIGGRFVVFVYADGADACAMADRWKQANTVNAYVVLKVFSGYRTCASQPDGWHQYGPAGAADSQGSYSYAISPGFYKVGEQPRLTRDLARWNQNVRDMVASGAQFQLVTTFNEWGEGTSVEGAAEWASSSWYGAYLDALHNNGSAAPATPTATPTTTNVQATATSVPATPTATNAAATATSANPTATATATATRTPTPTLIPTFTPTPTLVPTFTPTPTPTTPAGSSPCGTASSAPSTYQHVIWIWMENHRFTDVIGASTAPYETLLAQQCGAATNYAIVGSPSLPNYIGATAGTTFGIADDNPPSSHVLTGDNLFRQVRAAGMTEKSYQESMSGNCALSSSGLYAVKHNPAAYFAGGSDRTACQANNVPMGTTAAGAFITDLNNNTLPNFSFITPNLCNDTHDCSVATGDAWLKSWVPLILNSLAYRSGNTAVILMWDEPSPMPNVFIAPAVRPGTLSNTSFNHYSLLRTTEEMLGIGSYLGAASTAPSMRAAFGM